MAEGHQVRDVVEPMNFEIAWEVANKVGGIYTVIKSKVPVTVTEFGNRYVLLGPLNHKCAAVEVEVLSEIQNPALKQAVRTMSSHGINIIYGRWLIEGAPQVVLFDLASAYSRMDGWKGEFFRDFRISLPQDPETNDAIVFGYLIAWFLGEYSAMDKSRAIIAHFHEWQAGVGLMMTWHRNLDVATIFTTHATLLGRYLCAGSEDFYNRCRYYDVDKEAGQRGIYHKYCIERGAAHTSHVFTTVSNITAYEAEHLLKRRPDGLVPNGLNVVKFAAMHEFQNLHAVNKEKIHEFVKGHFYGNFDFDLENTLYFFTAGRYEFRNKGIDMFLESLARLNHRLKASNSKVTVIAFIILPAQTSSFGVETLKGQAVVKQLKDVVSDIQGRIGRRLLESALRGENTEAAVQLTSEEKILLKRRLLALRRNGLPPIVTHNVENDHKDQVLNEIRRLQLFNHSSDRVKVIFHPEFLNQASPLLGMDYEDFVRGCHLGVFPSYYEPWGYTPCECTVMGIPSITTNLSGFGCYMSDILQHPHEHGIYIVDRRMKSVEESCNQLADFMHEFAVQTRRDRITQRNRTERLSDLLDWKRMGKEYCTARKIAMKRKWPHMFQRSPVSSQGNITFTTDGGEPEPEDNKIRRPRSAIFKQEGMVLPPEHHDHDRNEEQSLGISTPANDRASDEAGGKPTDQAAKDLGKMSLGKK